MSALLRSLQSTKASMAPRVSNGSCADAAATPAESESPGRWCDRAWRRDGVDGGEPRPTRGTRNPSRPTYCSATSRRRRPIVWVADTTYLPVAAGFIFLVVIIDLYSRKVVGWSVGDKLDAELSGEALRRALGKRRPAAGLVFHSDRGSEFAAGSFRKLLAAVGAKQSMSRKGDCWDNAVAESFFSTLEFEGPSTSIWRAADEAEPELYSFVEAYYNSARLHSYNDYRCPNEAEADWRGRELAA
jgi:transposase InsO family protein